MKEFQKQPTAVLFQNLGVIFACSVCVKLRTTYELYVGVSCSAICENHASVQ
jgi:hypothetical protein